MAMKKASEKKNGGKSRGTEAEWESEGGRRGGERGLRRGDEEGRERGAMMRRRSPFQEMERMFGPLGQFMISPFMQRGGWAGLEQMWPSTDVYVEDDALVVKADLPGMRKEDVDVSIDRGDLVVSGERRHESDIDERNVYRSERAYGSFYRRVPLPEGADPEQVEARFRDGVLEVKVPLRQDERTERRRRIDVR